MTTANASLGPALRWTGPLIAALAAVAGLWDVRLSAGVLAGGLWNLASLWCLTRLLAAWLGPRPSRRRAIFWLIMKFPLLYLLVLGFFRMPSRSIAGFGAGFTVTLVMAVAWLSIRARQSAVEPSHGR